MIWPKKSCQAKDPMRFVCSPSSPFPQQDCHPPLGAHSLLHAVLHLNPLPPLSTPTKLSKHGGLHINQTKQGHEKIQSACEIFLSSIVSCHSAAAVRELRDCGKIRLPTSSNQSSPSTAVCTTMLPKNPSVAREKLCFPKPRTQFESHKITEGVKRGHFTAIHFESRSIALFLPRVGVLSCLRISLFHVLVISKCVGNMSRDKQNFSVSM